MLPRGRTPQDELVVLVQIPELISSPLQQLDRRLQDALPFLSATPGARVLQHLEGVLHGANAAGLKHAQQRVVERTFGLGLVRFRPVARALELPQECPDSPSRPKIRSTRTYACASGDSSALLIRGMHLPAAPSRKAFRYLWLEWLKGGIFKSNMNALTQLYSVPPRSQEESGGFHRGADQTQVLSGELPRAKSIAMKVWPGVSAPCDGCGQTIHVSHLEIELRFPDSRTVRLHFGCCRIWMCETGEVR